MTFFMVFVFGGFGSLARYGLGLLFPTAEGFPWTVFLINIVGSLGIGMAFATTMSQGLMSELTLMAITSGFLGGFTTFSTFSWQAYSLLQEGKFQTALLYLILSPVCGLFAAGCGWYLGRLLTMK